MNKNLLLLVLFGLLFFTACRKEEIKPTTEKGSDSTEQVDVMLKNAIIIPDSDTGTTSSTGGDGTPKPAPGTNDPNPIIGSEVVDPSDPFIRYPKKP